MFFFLLNKCVNILYTKIYVNYIQKINDYLIVIFLFRYGYQNLIINKQAPKKLLKSLVLFCDFLF